MNSKEVLTSILERVKATRSAGRRPVVVLDLDATLFDNGPRSWVILSEFAEEAKSDVLRVALKGYRKDSLPYLLKDMFTEMGLQNDELLESASKFWFERFFTDAYQAHDKPMAGAPKFVNELYNEGATIVYLSGRDSPGMLVGCSASLREHGFPVGLTNTAVVLKPDLRPLMPLLKKMLVDLWRSSVRWCQPSTMNRAMLIYFIVSFLMPSMS